MDFEPVVKFLASGVKMQAVVFVWAVSFVLIGVLTSVLAVYFLDSHVNRRSKRIQKDGVSKLKVPCRTCSTCGGLRFQVFGSPDIVEDAKKFESLRLWEQWLMFKTWLISITQQLLGRSFDYEAIKCKVKTEYLNLLLCLGQFSSLRIPLIEKGGNQCPRTNIADTVSEASNSTLTGMQQQVIPGDSLDTSVCSSIGSSESAVHNDSKRVANLDEQAKDSPLHRLVLEILLSPHDCEKKNVDSSMGGLKFKIETNATLEILSSLAELFQNKDSQISEHDVADEHVTTLLSSLPSNALSTLLGKLSIPNDQDVKVEYQDINETSCLPKVESDHTGLRSSDLVAITKQKDEQDLCCFKEHEQVFPNGKVKLTINRQISRNTPDQQKRKSVDQRLSSPEPYSVDPTIPNNTLKLTITSEVNNSTYVNPKTECGGEDTDGHVDSVLPSSSVSGLDSLHVTMVNATVDHQTLNKTDVGVTSALAVLNLPNKVGDHSQAEIMTLSDQQKSIHNHPSGGDVSSSRKEKKRKKNRGKKHKIKNGETISDPLEIKEIGKLVLENIKHISAVPEKDIGCVCGAAKGGSHVETCPYPFTSSGSMLQRKIKEQYDDLVQSNASRTLTLAQVGRFTTCLVEAKATLQQKSECIQRKFTIAKSLLSKADKSSFDRICGQIYGLEMEQKKLEEDTIVYNRLQEQLKLSPAYKKMLEYGRSHFELQPHTGQMIEKLEPEDTQMTFEELLEQEKKDVFWQKHGFVRAAV